MGTEQTLRVIGSRTGGAANVWRREGDLSGDFTVDYEGERIVVVDARDVRTGGRARVDPGGVEVFERPKHLKRPVQAAVVEPEDERAGVFDRASLKLRSAERHDSSEIEVTIDFEDEPS